MAEAGELTKKQATFVAALLTEVTVREAAATSGLSERQAYRLIRESPTVTAAYRRHKGEAVAKAGAALASAAYAAVATLVKNLACGQPSAEIRAAAAILDLVLKDDQEERLAEVETLLSELKGALGQTSAGMGGSSGARYQ